MNFNNKEYSIAVWNGEKLGDLIAFDCETEMITHESIIPELITLQIYDGNDTVYFVEADSIASFFDLHVSTNTKFIAHNAKFDMSVLQRYIGDERLYSLYDNNQVVDTAILFRLLHLATVGHLNTKYSLDYCVKRMTGIELPKDADIRTTFAQFKGHSPLQIPQGHLEYAAKDAIATMMLYLRLMPEIAAQDQMGTLLSHDIQVKGDWALGCIMRNGIGFDLARKEEWLKEQDETLLNLQRRLANYGWVRGQKGVNQRFEEILKWLDIADKLPRTSSGMISSSRKDLEKFQNVPFIRDYLDFNELEHATNFVRGLDTNRVHSRYNLLLNTGRTSASKPNIQQVPRVGGLREMYIPKHGHVLIDIDYSAIELAGLAQVCLNEVGFSTMGDLINEGKCLHYYTASNVYRKPEDQITKEERQFAKIPNFAFPTNMSPNTFIEYCSGYNVPMTLQQATDLKEAYKQSYPEISEHFWKVPRNDATVYTLTGRARANCTYTAYLNTKFQGLCADGLKLAMYELCKEGFTIVAEIHDQVVIEYPKNGTEESAMKHAEEIMIKAMKQVIPDIRVSTEGQILERWCK
jgi:DNA polymerase-1